MRRKLPAVLATAAVVLALAGTALSGYLAFENLRGETGVCVGVHGCSTVQNSRYGKPFGIPISVPGLMLYATLVVLAVAWLRDFAGRRPEIALAGFLGTFGGLLVSGYLTAIEAFVLDAWCSYCIVSALLVVALFIAWSTLLVLTLREETDPPN